MAKPIICYRVESTLELNFGTQERAHMATTLIAQSTVSGNGKTSVRLLHFDGDEETRPAAAMTVSLSQQDCRVLGAFLSAVAGTENAA